MNNNFTQGYKEGLKLCCFESTTRSYAEYCSNYPGHSDDYRRGFKEAIAQIFDGTKGMAVYDEITFSGD